MSLLSINKESTNKKPIKRKYNRKPKKNTSDNNQPSKRTRSKVSDLATEFLEHESDVMDD